MLLSTRLRQGLTLIELVVVVSVVGLLITITAISLKNFFRPSTEDVASKFADVIRHAYNTAQISHKTVIIEINLDKSFYKVYKLDREDGGIVETPILKTRTFPRSATVISLVDIRGYRTTEGIFKIPFSFGGLGMDLSIHLGDDGIVTRTILLHKYGGKVLVVPGEEQRTSKQSTKIDYGVDEKDDRPESNL